MGMPAGRGQRWTAEKLASLPSDGKRYEIIDGDLHVSPSPGLEHQRILWKLVVLVDGYVNDHPSWYGVLAPFDVVFSAYNVTQPDLFIARHEPEKPVKSVVARALVLAIEVVSPSSVRYDRIPKRNLYQRFKIPEYWIVDPDRRIVERWKPEDIGPEILTDAIVWQPPGEAAPFRVDLAELFGPLNDNA